MKILVTGGAGFIGSHITNRLLDLGAKVKVLDNLTTGCRENLTSDDSLIIGDIRDETLLRKCVVGCDTIFHLAAFTSVPLSFTKEKECKEINVVAFRNLLEIASEENVKTVVLSSTSALYPDDAVGSFDEDSITNPSSPYGQSKQIDEEILEEWCANNPNRSGIALRYFNVYGPQQDAGSDYASVIPKFIKQIFEGKPVTVYGEGHQTRDYVYVSDVVNANLLTCTFKGYNTFVVGTGKETSVLELFKRLDHICNYPVEKTFLPLPHGDAQSSRANISRLMSKGWKPHIDLLEGLQKTFEYFQSSMANDDLK